MLTLLECVEEVVRLSRGTDDFYLSLHHYLTELIEFRTSARTARRADTKAELVCEVCGSTGWEASVFNQLQPGKIDDCLSRGVGMRYVEIYPTSPELDELKARLDEVDGASASAEHERLESRYIQLFFALKREIELGPPLPSDRAHVCPDCLGEWWQERQGVKRAKQLLYRMKRHLQRPDLAAPEHANSKTRGSVRKRPDGRYELRFYVETEERLIRRSLYGHSAEEVIERFKRI